MKSDRQLAEEMVAAVFEVEAQIWNKAVDSCIQIMLTRWDDYNVIAEMKKLKR